MDYAAAGRKIEDLPSDGGRTVDTLAGAILRIFVRLNEIDGTLGRHDRRLGALESGVRPGPQPSTTSSRPPPAPEDRPEATPTGRRPGRPSGSRDTYPRQRRSNGLQHDDEHDGDGLDPERDLTS